MKSSERSTAIIYSLIGEGKIELVNGLNSMRLNGVPIVVPGSEHFLASKAGIGSIVGDTVTCPDLFKKYRENFSGSRSPKVFVLVHKAGSSLTGEITADVGHTIINTATDYFSGKKVNSQEGLGLIPKIRIPGAGPNGEEYVGVVVSVNSAKQAVIAPEISTAVTNANIYFDHISEVNSVTNDDVAVLNVAALTNVSNTRVELSSIDDSFSDLLGVSSFANFHDELLVAYRSGTLDQPAIPHLGGFSNATTGISINQDIPQHSDYYSKNTANGIVDFDPSGGSIFINSTSGTNSFALSDADTIDEVILTFNAPQLYRQKPKSGAESAVNVVFQIKLFVSTDSSNFDEYVIFGPTDAQIAAAGSNINYIDGKNSSRAPFLNTNGWIGGRPNTSPIKTAKDYEFRINLEPYKPFTQFRIEIKRITAKNYGFGDYEIYNNAVSLKSAQAVIKDTLTYPHSAIAAIVFDSNEFQGQLPEPSFEVQKVDIQVPTNYITREEASDGIAKYTRNVDTGVDTGQYQMWDGSFRGDKKEFGPESPNYGGTFCDNPAWGLRDLILNERYGLGDFIDESELDDYSFYSIARFCDELVPDGKGGLEPRFACSIYLQTKETAYKVLKDMATTFIGLIYWTDGNLLLDADRKKQPSYTFTKGNTIEGRFNYESTGSKVRPNQVIVSWENPLNDYKQTPEIVEDVENIIQTGYIISEDAVAFGCVSQGQARRYGLWKLLTARERKELVNFSTFDNAAHLQVGDVINVQDANRARISYSGRLLAGCTITSILLDRNVLLTANNYKLHIIYPYGAAYLTQASATINGIDYVFGDIIRANAEGTAINSEELTNNLVDDNDDLVEAFWSGDSCVEVVNINNNSETTSNLTATTAFPIAPSKDYIWALTEVDNEGNIVAGSPKTYRILSIKEDGDNYAITAVEHINSLYDEIDGSYELQPQKRVARPSDSIPNPKRFLVSPAVEDSTINSVNLNLSWDFPTENDSVYQFLQGFVIHHNVPGIANPIRVSSDVNYYTLYNVPEGEYDFRIQAVSSAGALSNFKLGHVTVSRASVVATKQISLLTGGTISDKINFINETLTFPDNYIITTVSGENVIIANATGSQKTIDPSNYNSTALSSGQTANLMFDYSDKTFRLVQQDNISKAIYELGSSAFTNHGTVTVQDYLITGSNFSILKNRFEGFVFKLGTEYARLIAVIDDNTMLVDNIFSAGGVLEKPALEIDTTNDFVAGKFTKL